MAGELAFNDSTSWGYAGTSQANHRTALNAALKDGAETLSGAKTLSGQLELTGQAATNGTSAMTRELVESFVSSDDEIVRGMLYREACTFQTFNYYAVSSTVTLGMGENSLSITTTAVANAGAARPVFFANIGGSIMYPRDMIFTVTLKGNVTTENDWMYVGQFNLSDATYYSISSPHYLVQPSNEGRFMVQIRKKATTTMEARIVWMTSAGVYNEGAWVDVGVSNFNESPKFLVLRTSGGSARTINAYIFHGTASGAGKPTAYKLADATFIGTATGITTGYAGYPNLISCGFLTPGGVAQTVFFSNIQCKH